MMDQNIEHFIERFNVHLVYDIVSMKHLHSSLPSKKFFIERASCMDTFIICIPYDPKTRKVYKGMIMKD